ncbi:hypothetical protein [Arthrobacter sp. OV608]|uniref:hypothetical protein n=1 Tax=Arthrobacter sp. OV608 TaxID=1882768 RepID=UPI0011138EF7|nr:hypothetical protein [Arthrobacter sp. OV608]
MDPAGPGVRGRDIQPHFPRCRHDAAGPIKRGIELFLLSIGVLALTPDPGSVRPLLAGTSVDTDFLSRRGDSSQARHGGQEFLLLRTAMGLLGTFTAVPAKARSSQLKQILPLRKN